MSAFFFEQFIFCRFFAAEFTGQVGAAAVQQVLVEFVQTFYFGYWHHEILACEGAEFFDDAFFVWPADCAEVVVEQVVACQLEESVGWVASVSAEDCFDGDFAVVVFDENGYSAEKVKSAQMAFPEGFGAF